MIEFLSGQRRAGRYTCARHAPADRGPARAAARQPVHPGLAPWASREGDPGVGFPTRRGREKMPCGGRLDLGRRWSAWHRRAGRVVRVAAGLPEAHVIPADLTRSGDIMRLVRETLDRFGRIDVLVNNAGLGRYDWIERVTADEDRPDLELNLIAPIVLARVVVPGVR